MGNCEEKSHTYQVGTFYLAAFSLVVTCLSSSISVVDFADKRVEQSVNLQPVTPPQSIASEIEKPGTYDNWSYLHSKSILDEEFRSHPATSRKLQSQLTEESLRGPIVPLQNTPYQILVNAEITIIPKSAHEHSHSVIWF